MSRRESVGTCTAQPEHLRLLVIGASTSEICGVRAYAEVLNSAFREDGASVTDLWWQRQEAWGLSESYRQLRSWVREVLRTIGEERPDCVLWHYSVFTYGWHGIPILLLPLLRPPWRKVPSFLMLHECAYPLGRAIPLGTVWGLSQRVVLRSLLSAQVGVVLTVAERRRWLEQRRWLPRRPSAVVPISSTLRPYIGETDRHHEGAFRVGIFSYGYQSSVIEQVTSSIVSLRSRGVDARLILIGRPGASSEQGRAWRVAAAKAGCETAVAFTGVLPDDELAQVISTLEVVVFADPPGPTGRKSSLAAPLALGTAVVAVDGPDTWGSLSRERAVLLTPTARTLVDDLELLAREPAVRREQAQRGASFYNARMAPNVSARKILSFMTSHLMSAPCEGPHIAPV